MRMRNVLKLGRWAPMFLVLVAWQAAGGSIAPADEPDRRAEFLRLCDQQRPIIEKQIVATEREYRVFYWDSYVVRAMCVAYDLTGKKEYLDTSKRWCDRMIEYQKGMIPEGAYYMQYGRKPGEKEGNWFSADSSSIALAVLATAVRCDEPSEKAKYLDSVKAFFRMVAEKFVRPSGGVTDGYWPKSDKEWWCSTGIFGSLAFVLYNETGDESCRKIGLGAIDWLNRQDWLTVAIHYPPEKIKPTVMLYCLEAYSPGMPHVERGSERWRGAMAQWDVAIRWMKENFGGRGGASYSDQWWSKTAALPFHLYVHAGYVGGRDGESLRKMADEELDYVTDDLKTAPPTKHRDQVAAFLLMSYAERVAPGKIYRTSKERP